MNKRLYKELQKLIIQQQSRFILDNDYLIHFDDENIFRVYAIIKGPYDSVYRHKFIRLDLDIPEEYPYKPPRVTFINYDGVRIHPTLYEDGRCCSTILNTWPSVEQDNVKKEAWTSSMGIETILLMFHSFLDNHPYTHEPGGIDNITYTHYVLHQTWKTCLLRYLYIPQCTIFTDFINTYLSVNIRIIFNDLHVLKSFYPYGIYNTPCFYIDNYVINYDRIIYDLDCYYNHYLQDVYRVDEDQPLTDSDEDESEESDSEEDTDEETEASLPTNSTDELGGCKCQICFENIDTNTNDQAIFNKKLILECGHYFHTFCIKRHILHNGNLCSICREKTNINEWVINPETNRKIKIDSTTFKTLHTNLI